MVGDQNLDHEIVMSYAPSAAMPMQASPLPEDRGRLFSMDTVTSPDPSSSSSSKLHTLRMKQRHFGEHSSGAGAAGSTVDFLAYVIKTLQPSVDIECFLNGRSTTFLDPSPPSVSTSMLQEAFFHEQARTRSYSSAAAVHGEGLAPPQHHQHHDPQQSYSSAGMASTTTRNRTWSDEGTTWLRNPADVLAQSPSQQTHSGVAAGASHLSRMFGGDFHDAHASSVSQSHVSSRQSLSTSISATSGMTSTESVSTIASAMQRKANSPRLRGIEEEDMLASGSADGSEDHFPSSPAAAAAARKRRNSSHERALTGSFSTPPPATRVSFHDYGQRTSSSAAAVMMTRTAGGEEGEEVEDEAEVLRGRASCSTAVAAQRTPWAVPGRRHHSSRLAGAQTTVSLSNGRQYVSPVVFADTIQTVEGVARLRSLLGATKLIRDECLEALHAAILRREELQQDCQYLTALCGLATNPPQAPTGIAHHRQQFQQAQRTISGDLEDAAKLLSEYQSEIDLEQAQQQQQQQQGELTAGVSRGRYSPMFTESRARCFAQWLADRDTDASDGLGSSGSNSGGVIGVRTSPWHGPRLTRSNVDDLRGLCQRLDFDEHPSSPAHHSNNSNHSSSNGAHGITNNNSNNNNIGCKEAASSPQVLQESWRHRLGPPPSAYRNYFEGVMTNMEAMWNCELESFETFKQLASNIVLRESTWRRVCELLPEPGSLNPRAHASPRVGELFDVEI